MTSGATPLAPWAAQVRRAVLPSQAGDSRVRNSVVREVGRSPRHERVVGIRPCLPPIREPRSAQAEGQIGGAVRPPRTTLTPFFSSLAGRSSERSSDGVGSKLAWPASDSLLSASSEVE